MCYFDFLCGIRLIKSTISIIFTFLIELYGKLDNHNFTWWYTVESICFNIDNNVHVMAINILVFFSTVSNDVDLFDCYYLFRYIDPVSIRIYWSDTFQGNWLIGMKWKTVYLISYFIILKIVDQEKVFFSKC